VHWHVAFVSAEFTFFKFVQRVTCVREEVVRTDGGDFVTVVAGNFLEALDLLGLAEFQAKE